MPAIATLTKTGQITIPKEIRDHLGLKPGQKIIFRKTKDAARLEREKTASEIAEEIDKLIPAEVREYHMAHYAGLTANEAIDKWLETDDAKEYFAEEYRRTL